MNDEPRQERDPEAVELEREVRSERRYSLSEAIGRAAGDLLKGASPVTRRRQVELEVEQYFEDRLPDAGGALAVVLRRRVLEGEQLLERSYERPLEAVASIVDGLLDSPPRLRRFVRDVDAEWGRITSERPYFEVEGAPPQAGDPYTLASVRAALARLREALVGDAGS